MTRPRRYTLWVFVTALALSRATSAGAEDPHFANGNQAFRFTLGSLCGFRSVASIKDVLSDPEHTILVVTGDLSELGKGELWLNQFLQRNGSMLMATDRGDIPFITNRIIGVTVAGGYVKALDPATRYKGNEECPVVEFPARPDFPGGDLRVATNRPSHLRRVHLPPAGIAHRFVFHSIASFPDGCRVDGTELGPFAVAHSGERQRLLILADHSVFINSMMLQDDNANMRFAEACLNWLGENGRRTRVLYLNDGKVVADFTVSPQEIPLPLPSLPNNLPVPPAEVLNKIAAAWEDDNIHNQLILDRFSRNQILRVVAVGVTVALLGYGVLRLWSARHSTEPGR